MTYQQSTSSTGSSTSSATSTSDASNSEAQLMLQIMKLAQAYGLFGTENSNTASVSAVA